MLDVVSRLAIVTPEYPTERPAGGGIGSQYGALAPALAAIGVDVHVFLIGAPAARQTSRDGVTVHEVTVVGHVGVLWPVARAIAARRVVEKWGPFDAVVPVDWKGDGALLSEPDRKRSVTNLQTGAAVYEEISETPVGGRRPGVRQRVLLHAERRQGERSAGILSCSDALLQRTRRYWRVASTPSAVFPNVILYDKVRSLASMGDRLTELSLTEGRPTIMMPGRLETRKGVGVLLDAMPYVWREHPDARLLLIGALGLLDGRPTSDRVSEVARDHPGRVQVVGQLRHDVLFPLLGRADVIVTPSLWEAFGIATLEAMALGCRVVATSGSGFAEFCEDGVNSILVPPKDAVALAAGICHALGDSANVLGRAAEGTARGFDAHVRAPEFCDRLGELLVGSSP